MSVLKLANLRITGLSKSGMYQIVACTLLLTALIFLTQEKVSLKTLFLSRYLPPPDQGRLYVENIDLGDALILFHRTDVIFVDVRKNIYYNYGHIKGAISMPVNEIDAVLTSSVSKLKSARVVILYCNDASCVAPDYVASRLEKTGVKDIKIYSDGWREWHNCQLPTDPTVVK